MLIACLFVVVFNKFFMISLAIGSAAYLNSEILGFAGEADHVDTPGKRLLQHLQTTQPGYSHQWNTELVHEQHSQDTVTSGTQNWYM